MISLELLKAFCATDETRSAIHAPWARDGYTYATDGRIIVRVPAMTGTDASNDAAPNASQLPWGLFDSAQFVPLPNIPEPLLVACEDCEGCGAFDNNSGNPKNGGDIPCEECDCKGKWEKAIAVQVGSRQLSNIYLRKIATLPNPLIATNGERIDPAPFMFDGGDGLLMPMRL